MSELKEIGDIQINEDPAFQRRDWQAQRVGWITMLILLVLALAGAFGNGPLSRAAIGSQDIVEIAYERVLRHAADAELRVVVAPALNGDSALTVYISSQYLNRFTDITVTPEPSSTGKRGAWLYYVFSRPDPRLPTDVTFHYNPDRYWLQKGAVAVDGNAPLRFTQLVLP